MSQGLLLTIMNMTFYEILVISLPLLGTAMVVGLIVSIFQATTSIQEQTLTFVPKMIIILVLLIIIGPFLVNSLIDFTKNLFQLIAEARM
ncbi:MAG: flagellar biosynthesis protein FliQ [Brevinematales bacterium]|nr:flagellar biosynthesis protein FliQ [Brevinematales bacterium]